MGVRNQKDLYEKKSLSLPNIVPLFLSPIVICQQLLLVVIDNRKGFWRAKLPRFHTKPSNFCNIKIVIKSQPYTGLV